VIARRIGFFVLGLGVVAGEIVACSSSNPPPVAGSGGHSTHTTTSRPSSSSGSTTSSGATLTNLGATCAADADCGGAPLKCTTPTAKDPVFGGGPANGYCTLPCMTDGDCGSTGLCLTDTNGMNGTCVSSCSQGPMLQHINDPIMDTTKCQARPDVACTMVSMTQAACLPVCGEDSQCPSGMHCDPRAAVCVTTASTGFTNGKVCDADAGTPQCAGVCLVVGLGPDAGVASICSSQCVLGADPNTAQTPAAWTDCGGVKNGLCAYLSQNEGAGDLGSCTNACLTQDDCPHPDFWCYGITGITGTGTIKNGWCFSGTPCPGGNADCTANGFPGSTCAMTTYGPQCVSAQFPLGSAAVDGGTPTPDGGSEGGTDAGPG
jgi:hypothetical protein